MAAYDYLPTHLNGTSLTGGNLDCFFRQENGPLQTRRFQPVEAEVTGLGDRDVRAQPKGSTWNMHVILTNVDESDLESFFKIFDEEAGLVTLRADDGDGTNWKVDCRVIQIQRRQRKYFIVVIRVPDPVWLENSLTTDSQLNKSGDSISFTLTNNGNRRSPPTFTIDPDNVKTDILEDYKYSLRGFVANHTPNIWNDKPIQLLDQSGAPAIIDHDAIVNQAKRAEVNDGGDGLDATQTSIGYDAGTGGNPPTLGIIKIGNEQITYTGGGGSSSGTLTGCTRGVGGTTAATHSENDAINFSEGLDNGDDIRVWWNGVEVDRWLDGAGTTTLKIFINVTMPARVKLTLEAAITAGSPADGGELDFNESSAQLPERGVVHIADEVISYTGRTAKKLTGIERGAWGSTAAAASKDDPVYRIDGLYVISSGKGNAGAASAPLSRRPAIQLKASTNKVWYYGDEADDALTVFYDPDELNRTAMWAPSVNQADDDKAVALRQQSSKVEMAWQDSDAIAGKPARNQLALTLPQEIKAASNAITYDVQKRRNMVMRLRVTDRDGIEVEVVSASDVDEALSAAQTVTPDAPLTRIIARATRVMVLGANEKGTDTTISSAGTGRQLKVILDQETAIVGLMIRIGKDSGTFTCPIEVLDNSGADPDKGAILGILGTFDQGDLNGSALEYKQFITNKLTLVAGTYWLSMQPSSGSFKVDTGINPQTKQNQDYDGSFENRSWWFRLLHETDEGGPIQVKVELLNEGGAGDFDKIILVLNDDSGDPRTPYVHRMGGFTNGLYHAVPVINNTTTGDTITVDAWLPLTAALEIDCGDREVKYTDGNHVIHLPMAIVLSDLENWIFLQAGANSMTYSEDNMVSTDLTSTFRGAKQ